MRYKRATGLTDEETIRDQLLSSCSEELAEDMGPVFIDDGVEQNTGPMVRPMTAVQGRGTGSR